jgi:hypothetical protein
LPGPVTGNPSSGAPATGAPAQSPGSGRPGERAPSGAPRGESGGGSGQADPLARLAPQPPPGVRPQPRTVPLRPALLGGEREWVIFVECQRDAVILYPTRRPFSLESLSHSPAHNPLYLAVRQLLARRQALIRPGERPLQPHIRYLVHPDAVRTYHMTYPALERLSVPQTRQNLQPEDDVSAIVAGS